MEGTAPICQTRGGDDDLHSVLLCILSAAREVPSKVSMSSASVKDPVVAQRGSSHAICHGFERGNQGDVASKGFFSNSRHSIHVCAAGRQIDSALSQLTVSRHLGASR